MPMPQLVPQELRTTKLLGVELLRQWGGKSRNRSPNFGRCILYSIAIIAIVAPAAVADEIKFGPAENTGRTLSLELLSGSVGELLAGWPPRGRVSYAGGNRLSEARLEDLILHYTNVERKAAGLKPLNHDRDLSNIARGHSRDMTRFGLYHEINGKGPTDRALEAGYKCRFHFGDGSYSDDYSGLGENISEYPRITEFNTQMIGNMWRTIPSKFSRDSRDMALAIVRSWMNSPGHRRNILDSRYSRIGIGVAIEYEKVANSVDLYQERVFSTQNFSFCQ